MNLNLLILICTFYFIQPSISQEYPIPQTGSNDPSENARLQQGNPDRLFSCDIDLYHEYLMANDPAYRKNFLYHKHQLDSLLSIQSNNRSSFPSQYTIPVVVHIIHLGEPVGTGSNISDEQIQDAINGLNERYANANGKGANCEIQFCLATRTPDGCLTNGINRVDGSGVPGYALNGIKYNTICGADEAAIKSLSRWSPLDFYNIWVVHDICGDWAGYAQFPNGGELDGTVIDDNFMNRESKTLAHELGHGLNIKHTFNGDGGGFNCPVNANCTVEGDAICDTPPHRRNDCGANNPCSAEGEWDNSRYNWMNYCDLPVSIGRFTQGQRDRMHASLMVYPRNALLNSIGCTPVDLPAFTSDDLPMCTGETKILTAVPPGGTFSLISGPGVLQGNELIATNEGIIYIQYTACNGIVEQSIQTFETPHPVLIISNDTMCSNTKQIISGEPSGGDLFIMSGPGSLIENELNAEAPGIIEIVYSIELNGCSGNALRDIVVELTPVPKFHNSDDAMCAGESRVLNASPGEGEFYIVSGPASIHGDTLITEGIGAVEIGYSVAFEKCTGSTTQTILVHGLTSPQMTSSSELLCSGDVRILSADPSGGVFSVRSGPGEIKGDTLFANGSGEIEIQYTWNQNGCEATTNQMILAQQSPGVIFAGSQDHFCMQDSISLFANPPGGIFEILSGPGILDSNILSANSGGDILVRYSITQVGCTGSEQKIFSSIDVSQLAFTMDTSMMCSGDERPLSATPGGGIFWMIGGPANISNSVLRSTGEGLIKIQYLINEEGCYGEITQRIPSRRTPSVQFPADSMNICVGQEKLIAITPDSSQLTLLYGAGTLNGHWVTSPDTGQIKVTGQFEANGCAGTDTMVIISNPIPLPEIIGDNPVMCIGSSIQLAAAPSGGVFNHLSGPGSIHQNILTAQDIGRIHYAYTVEEHQCAGTVFGEILVIHPVAEIITTGDMLISSTPDGIFQWLDCENNFGPLPGENNDTLFVTSSGKFALVNGVVDCIDTSECVLVQLTAETFGERNHGVRIFPNPVSSHLYIDVPESESIKEITLRNAVGEKVYAQRDWEPLAGIDMTGCVPGLYFLEVRFDGGGYVGFVVVRV